MPVTRHQTIIHFLAEGAQQTNKRRATQKIQGSSVPCLELQRRGAAARYVIEYRGGPVRSIKKGFSAACTRAGLSRVIPDTLKHTRITWLVQAELRLEEVAAFSSTSTRTRERVY